MFNLKEFRIQKDMTLKQMGEVLGITPQNYKREEDTRKILSIKNAIILANYFNISLDTIYSEELTTNDIDKELNIKFSLLSEEDKKIILSIIDKILSK